MKKRTKLTRWHKLDNTANIFPVIANKKMTNVFRITAILSERVDGEVLQAALEETVPYFAAFNVRLRHGLFWSYLETNRATPHVQLEEDTPCSYLDTMETDRFLFRVFYYKNRVHLETFHVLSDGVGALCFLKAICYCYCKRKMPEKFTPAELETLYGIENADNIEDAYLKNYVPAPSKTFKETNAYHLHGYRRVLGDLEVITALMPVEKLKEECHRFGVSVGAYLTALIGYAVYEEYQSGHGAKQPVNIFVPVDLRRVFKSETSLNFFSNIIIELPLAVPEISFETVLEQVKMQFAQKLQKSELQQKLAFTVRSETSLLTRVIPLPLKNGILRIVYEHSSNGSTLPFSNLGNTDVEPPFKNLFEGFRFLMSTTPKEPVKVAAIAYHGTVALTFTCILEENLMARNMVRRLAKAGIPITIESNGEPDEVL
ncbi:MAG: hypothetical protein RSD01_00480 [Ruthenibacterium sp.]